MLILLRSAATIGMIIAFMAGALAAPKTASAEPVPKASYPSGTRTVTISPKTWNKIKKSAAVTKANLKGERTTSTLDYRIAKRTFSAISSARKFAAGWDWSGGRISHISDYERRKVAWHKQQQFMLTPLKVCRGVSKQTFDPDWKYDAWTYLDSCQTNKLIRDRGGVLALCGLADKIFSKIKHPAGWIGQGATSMCVVFFALRTLDIVEARANSPVGGVVVGTKYVTTRSGTITTQTWRPQWRSDQ